MLTNGEIFGKYKVERMLGTGGMGAVYLVRHRVLDSHFALKILEESCACQDNLFPDYLFPGAHRLSVLNRPFLVAFSQELSRPPLVRLFSVSAAPCRLFF